MRNKRPIPKTPPRFAFLVDGRCEFWYIQMLKRNERNINIVLKPEIPQKKSIEDQYKKVSELAFDYDKVFWIIDMDAVIYEQHQHKNGKETPLQKFEKYFDKAGRIKNVVTIINNPCFEYWLLLHFEQTSKYFRQYSDLEPQLIKWLPDYEKTQKYYTQSDNDIYSRLRPKLETAIANAQKLGDFDFTNPSTGLSQMNRFFDLLLNIREL